LQTIDLAALQQAMHGLSWCPRLLLRTGAVVSERGFPDAWPSLDESAVDWLLSQGLVLLGVDCPSVDSRHSTTLPVHHALFSRGAYVLENLSLGAVSPGVYELSAAPLLIVGADAAPVRALLRRR
jgi:arylformamidase